MRGRGRGKGSSIGGHGTSREDLATTSIPRIPEVARGRGRGKGGVSLSMGGHGTYRENLATTSIPRIPEATRGRGRGGGGVSLCMGGHDTSREDLAATFIPRIPEAARGRGRCGGGVSSSMGGHGTSREDLATTSIPWIPEAARGRGRGRGGGGGGVSLSMGGHGTSREDLATTSIADLGFDDDDDDDDDLDSESGLHGSNATEQASTHPPLPSNREWIEVQGEQFCSGEPTRQITDNLKSMFGGPWTSWKVIPPESRTRLWERFTQFFQWPNDLEGRVHKAWKQSMKKRVSDTLCKARKKAFARARMAGMEVGDDISVIIPFGPPWINHEYWKQLVEEWKTDRWKAISKVNKKNKNSLVEGSVGKHTAGSVSFLVTKLKMEKSLGRPVRYSEHYMTTHITKRSREAMVAGTGEPEFVTAKAQRLLEEYVKGMSDAYGDIASQPLGDLGIWEQVVGGKKKGILEGCGSNSDPSYLVTGETSHVQSSMPAGVASSDEVRELKQEIQELREREERLVKEIEESRKEMEEFRKREEETRKATQNQLNEMHQLLLSHFRVNPPPPPPI